MSNPKLPRRSNRLSDRATTNQDADEQGTPNTVAIPVATPSTTSLPRKRKVQTIAVQPFFEDFDDGQRSQIQEVLRRRPHRDILITKFNLTIRRESLSTLSGRGWLDDNVINFYMALLVERSELPGATDVVLPVVFAYSVFFGQRLMADAEREELHTWSHNLDVFARDVLLVPMHVDNEHWALVVVDFRQRSIRFYDSRGDPDNGVLERLRGHLEQEHRGRGGDGGGGNPFDMTDWRVESMLATVPQQTNDNDCGVFCCAYAEAITRDAPIDFGQQHMRWMRQKMALEVATGQLMR